MFLHTDEQKMNNELLDAIHICSTTTHDGQKSSRASRGVFGEDMTNSATGKEDECSFMALKKVPVQAW